MNDPDLVNLWGEQNEPTPVTVRATDYVYEGWLVAVFTKRRGPQVRAVVEDANGRLFIHNAGQLRRGHA